MGPRGTRKLLVGQVPREGCQSPAQAWLPTSERTGLWTSSNQGPRVGGLTGQREPQDRRRGWAPRAGPGLTQQARLWLEHRAAKRGSQALGSEIRGSRWFWATGTGIQEATSGLGLSPGRWHPAEQTACKTTPSHGYQPPHSSCPPSTNKPVSETQPKAPT